MARHMFDWVSLDATSWRFAADHAEYFNLCDLSRENLGSRVTIDARIENDCPCPRCKGFSFKQIKEMPIKNRRSLLRGHNWFAVDKCFRDLYENSTSVIQLERFLKKRSKRPADVKILCSALSLVDVLKDFDIGELENVLRSFDKTRKTVCKHKSNITRKQTVPA